TVSAVPPAAAVPTGSVTFNDGATSLGVVTLVNGSASLTTSALPAGSRSLTAVYGGSATFQGSTSPAVTPIVNPRASSPTLASSPPPSPFGQVVTLPATVSAVAPAAGVPS